MMVMMMVMPCGLPVEQQGGGRRRRDSELHTTYQNLQRTEEPPAAARGRLLLVQFHFSELVHLLLHLRRPLSFFFRKNPGVRVFVFPSLVFGHGCCSFGLCFLLLRSILVVYEDKSLQVD
jgi:hypothetical protein